MERKKRRVLKFSDRQKIEEMSRAGITPAEMAEVVGVHKATIYSELRRCQGEYNAERAQMSV